MSDSTGKIRVTATTACDRKALQINLHAFIANSKGKTVASHRVPVHQHLHAFVTNPAGRQAWLGVNSPLVNDSFTARGAKVSMTA